MIKTSVGTKVRPRSLCLMHPNKDVWISYITDWVTFNQQSWKWSLWCELPAGHKVCAHKHSLAGSFVVYALICFANGCLAIKQHLRMRNRSAARGVKCATRANTTVLSITHIRDWFPFKNIPFSPRLSVACYICHCNSRPFPVHSSDRFCVTLDHKNDFWCFFFWSHTLSSNE